MKSSVPEDLNSGSAESLQGATTIITHLWKSQYWLFRVFAQYHYWVAISRSPPKCKKSSFSRDLQFQDHLLSIFSQVLCGVEDKTMCSLFSSFPAISRPSVQYKPTDCQCSVLGRQQPQWGSLSLVASLSSLTLQNHLLIITIDLSHPQWPCTSMLINE